MIFTAVSQTKRIRLFNAAGNRRNQQQKKNDTCNFELFVKMMTLFLFQSHESLNQDNFKDFIHEIFNFLRTIFDHPFSIGAGSIVRFTPPGA